MELILTYMTPLGQCIATIGLGWALRQSIFTEIDTNAVFSFVRWVSLPSFVFYNLVNALPIDLKMGSYAAVAFLLSALTTSALSRRISSFSFSFSSTSSSSATSATSPSSPAILRRGAIKRMSHPKERGLLSGTSVGWSCATAGLPVAALLFGSVGAVSGVLCTGMDLIFSSVIAYAFFAEAGPAFPEEFRHEDGGSYRGEWKGMLKEGYGVYTYPSGAKYEGEWRDGVKEGRGVYRFPKGGVYEGEWRSGTMTGVGVRTYSDGRTKSGVWNKGKFDSPLEEWQCALVVEGANEASMIARRVMVGGASIGAAIRTLISEPAFWALVVSIGMLVTGKTYLTPTIAETTKLLAQAHVPLALLSFGLNIDVSPPRPHQIVDVARVIATRLLPALLVPLAVFYWVSKVKILNVSIPAIAALSTTVLCLIGPAPQSALQYAHIFRLNENIAAAILRTSTMVSLFLYPFLVSATILSIKRGSPDLLAVAVAFAVLGTLALTSFVRLQANKGKPFATRDQKVKMVYAGPASIGSSSSASGAVEASPTVTPLPESLASGVSEAGEQGDATESGTGEESQEANEGDNQSSQLDSPRDTAEDHTNASKERSKGSESPRRSKFRDVDLDGVSNDSERGAGPLQACLDRNVRAREKLCLLRSKLGRARRMPHLRHSRMVPMPVAAVIALRTKMRTSIALR